MCFEGHFTFVAFSYVDIVISPSYVYIYALLRSQIVMILDMVSFLFAYLPSLTFLSMPLHLHSNMTSLQHHYNAL